MKKEIFLFNSYIKIAKSINRIDINYIESEIIKIIKTNINHKKNYIFFKDNTLYISIYGRRNIPKEYKLVNFLKRNYKDRFQIINNSLEQKLFELI